MGIKSRRWGPWASGGSGSARARDIRISLFSNDYGVSELYFNDGKTFPMKLASSPAWAFSPKSGMNASVGDILNQGPLCRVRVEHLRGGGVLIQGNNLWIAQRRHPRRQIGSLKIWARDFGVGNRRDGVSGAQFGDLNNDGTLDLYLTNGIRLARPRQELLVRFFQDRRRPTAAIINDAKNWPPMEGRSLSGYQTKHFVAERRQVASLWTWRRRFGVSRIRTDGRGRGPL